MAVALVFEMAGREADALSDAVLGLGASSVTVEDAAAGTPEERAIFDEPDSAPAVWARFRVRLIAEDEATARECLRTACEETGVANPSAVTVEPVEDQDWVKATQAQFPPIRVSRRLWIVPSWQTAPDATAINIVLDPGRAFGTGSHPTTRLCLEWLDTAIRGGESVLDYGCGSGILAIAAARLGAGTVMGMDIDPQAVETANANAAANGVKAQFVGADRALTTPADVVVANILANPLIVLAPVISALTRPGGRVALSGILSDQFDEVVEAYSPWFLIDGPAISEGWVRVTGVRRDSA